MIDVSFISLALVLGPVAATLRTVPSAPIVALVKPQFEVGKGGTDHGVVRDPAAHRAVLQRIVAAARELGLGARAVIASPILGPEGNREFLVHLQAGPSCAEIGELIDQVTGAPEMTVQRIGFAYNPTNDAAVELRERAAGWCRMHGIDHWAAQAQDFDTLCRELETTDVLVVLGGDGTLLRAARAVIQVDVPMLGVNLGKIGFLSKVEAIELEGVLAKLVARDEQYANEATRR